MIRFDPASFKDPTGRVFHHESWVGRTLSATGRSAFESARDAGLIAELVQAGLLVPTELVRTDDVGLNADDVGEYILKQPRVPLVTYPYEWSFEMLRDAALVTLRAMQHALSRGFILKDATSFNVLFDGRRPLLVDAPSIIPRREGDLWAGYSQFCRCFLFPLLVAAHRDLDLQSILRGTLGELPVRDARRLLRSRDLVRPGVFTHVVLQARLERSFASEPAAVKAATPARYPVELIAANVGRLRTLIERLPPPMSGSEWSDYEVQHSYSVDDRAGKMAFVEGVVTKAAFPRVVDVGCNTGEYSETAARAGSEVIAIDSDTRAIDRLYRRPASTQRIFPLVANLLNPTPSMGWALRERQSLRDRIKSPAFLALALIHHLRITGNVPLEAILDELFAIAPEGVIEWVDKDDEMVRRMLSLRPDVYDDYTWPRFEALVKQRGRFLAVQPSHGGRRMLCHVRG